MKSSSIWLRRGALVLASVVFSLVVMEGAARVFHLGSGGFWEPNPQYGWRNIPGADGWESCYGECAVHVHINSLGLRDTETTYSKPDSAHRILLLGDSMTAGLQVELDKTFGEQLQRGLDSTDNSWEVINAAVNGFGTDNELIYFDDEGRKFHPDIVVLGMYLANDVYNNQYELEVRYGGSGHKPYYTLSTDGTLVLHNYPVENTGGMTVKIGTFLKRNFQLPRFFAQVLKLRSQVPDLLRPIVQTFGGSRGAQADGAGGQGAQNGDICDQTYSPEVEDAWAITKALILKLRDDVEASGAHLVVLVIPASPQIKVPVDGRGWYCDRPNQELDGFLRQQGIPAIDMLWAFRSHAVQGGPSLYYTHDFHMNAEGHTLTAQQLEDYFKPYIADHYRAP